ncbi:Gmad2 immunoglobulin-like domain-containing protein [Candidatus Nomurabacteria bacterium]|nr:Gmad2 immunoglobulin-like domain-containing protein [Candidatus Nomurabacteria bacterium]
MRQSFLRVFALFILVFILGVMYLFSLKSSSPKNEEQIACTMDAKMCPDGSYVGRSGLKCEFTPCPEPKADKSDFIKVSNPQPNQIVTSPLELTGEARLWYFEGSFPVEILDANGKKLGVSYVQAEGEWMTTEFVPFKGNLIFSSPETSTGTLILRKDNPSDMRELDDSISIPIRFSP